MIITHSVPPPVGCTSPWLPALPEPAHLLEVKPAVGCFSSCKLIMIKMVMIMIKVVMIMISMAMVMIKVVMIWIKMVMIINQDQDDGDQDEVLHFLFLINHPLSGPSGDRPTCTTRHACQRRCHRTFVHSSRTACSSPQLSMSTSSFSQSFSSPNDSSPPKLDMKFGRKYDRFFLTSASVFHSLCTASKIFLGLLLVFSQT